MDARIRAAVAVAREYGLRVDDAAVLRDRANLLVRLRPAPVVVRVAAGTALVRAGGAWFRREVEVAAFLAARGAPVVAPSPLLPPGPHERDGVLLSFWTPVDEVGPVDPVAAGGLLRRCHDLLRDHPGALPRWGAVHEAAAMLARAGRDRERSRLLELLAEVETAGLPEQAVHGDAHLGNVLQAADGPRWLDWEDAFAGPVGWDVACLLASAAPWGRRDPAAVRAAADATGHDVPPELLDALVELRRIQITAWTAMLRS